MNGKPFHRAVRGIIRCPQIPRESHALLICLLDASNQDGEVWLSQQEIRERTGYAIRTIRYWVGRLVTCGYLSPIYPGGRSKDGQRRWASRFKIDVESLWSFDPQPASDCRSGDERDRQANVAQPASNGSATGNGTSRNRQQVAPYRLNTDLDRLNTDTLADFPPFLQGDPHDDATADIEDALYALHPLGAARTPGTWKAKANSIAAEYGEQRVLEALRWAKEKGKAFADAMARVRQKTWDEAKEKPAVEEGQPWTFE